MVTGRPRKPTAVHEANGSYRKNPNRRRGPEPTADRGKPTAPELIRNNKDLSEIWDEVCEVCDSQKTLHLQDVFAMEMFTLNLAVYRRLAKKMAGGKALQRDDANAFKFAATQHAKLLSELGLTPANRSRIPVVPDMNEGDDDFTELCARFG